MPRIADDILIGGGRVFIGTGQDREDLGWLASSEIKLEEQSNSYAVKESEGGTVLTINLDREVHLTFSLLEANYEALMKLNPSYTKIGGAGDTTSDGEGYALGSYQRDNTYQLEFWHKKRSGKYRCYRFFKCKMSGTFTPLVLNQDNESPLAIDITALKDDSKPTTRDIYETFECEAANAPGGGW